MLLQISSYPSCSCTPHTAHVPQRDRTWTCHQAHLAATAGLELSPGLPISHIRASTKFKTLAPPSGLFPPYSCLKLWFWNLQCLEMAPRDLPNLCKSIIVLPPSCLDFPIVLSIGLIGSVKRFPIYVETVNLPLVINQPEVNRPRQVKRHCRTFSATF